MTAARLAAACAWLLPCALLAQAPALRLFAPTMRQPHDPEQERCLAPAEERMRFVELQAAPDDGIAALGRPLDLELFPDARYAVQLQRDPRGLAGLEVWKGRAADTRFDHLPHYRNAVFVLNRATGRLVANIETAQGFFQILPTAEEGLYRVRQCKPFGQALCQVRAEATEARGATATLNGCGGLCNEADADGRYVVDVLAAYSESAAAVAGDLEAHAQANIETVNMGLANSQIDTLYLRLVGTATTPHNPGIVTSVLDDAWDWFAQPIAELAPDLIAVFQTPTNDPGSAGGWGGMPGRATVNGVEWPTVFRHEAGHNAGGNHCYPDNEDYRNGYDNGHWRTHLCGNDVNFYSTPLVNDDQGNPIGHADEADMARNWAEMAFTMANYAMHRVPYAEGDTCINRTCLPEHWGDPIEYISRVRFNTLDHLQADPSWNCPQVPGYSDHLALSTEVQRGSMHLLQVESTYSWDESTMRAWIDWDGDGILAASEKVMDLAGEGPWAAPVTVPDDAAIGAVRLRIRLQYGLDEPIDPCRGSAYSSGETEDYTVHILMDPSTEAAGAAAPSSAGLLLLPNPAAGAVSLAAPGLSLGPVRIMLRDASGRIVLEHQAAFTGSPLALDVEALAAGPYLCTLHHRTGIRVARLMKH